MKDKITILDIEEIISDHVDFEIKDFVQDCKYIKHNDKDMVCFEVYTKYETFEYEICGGIVHEYLEGNMSEDRLKDFLIKV